MKVGLFFGSFNPIHTGHLIIGESTLNHTDIDEIWFVVSPQNPMKKRKDLLSEYDRIKLVDIAIEGNDRFRSSNIEFSLPKPSYTIDTLTHLSERHRAKEFCIIMGEDNLRHIHKWKNYEQLIENYPIFVYPRGQHDSAIPTYDNVTSFELPLLDISSTQIRSLIREQKSIRYVVRDGVRELLEKEQFYLY